MIRGRLGRLGPDGPGRAPLDQGAGEGQDPLVGRRGRVGAGQDAGPGPVRRLTQWAGNVPATGRRRRSGDDGDRSRAGGQHGGQRGPAQVGGSALDGHHGRGGHLEALPSAPVESAFDLQTSGYGRRRRGGRPGRGPGPRPARRPERRGPSPSPGRRSSRRSRPRGAGRRRRHDRPRLRTPAGPEPRPPAGAARRPVPPPPTSWRRRRRRRPAPRRRHRRRGPAAGPRRPGPARRSGPRPAPASTRRAAAAHSRAAWSAADQPNERASWATAPLSGSTSGRRSTHFRQAATTHRGRHGRLSCGGRPRRGLRRGTSR